MPQLDVRRIAAAVGQAYGQTVANLSSRDVRDVHALINVAYSAKGSQRFAETAVATLARLIPSEIVGYNERELASRHLLIAAETPSDAASPEVTTAVSTFCRDYPLSMQRNHSQARALKISDLVSQRRLHQLDYYNYALRPLGIEHQIRLWLSAPAGVARYFSFSRDKVTGDFSERDRELLELVRPFLNALQEQLDTHNPDRLNDDGLTDREVEILALVARGKTNQEIATLLVVSPHTIRKHLENAYQKLRVHTRTAAVARAFATSS
jgi:DNA-binding CsgD family transcriptional regulator